MHLYCDYTIILIKSKALNKLKCVWCLPYLFPVLRGHTSCCQATFCTCVVSSSEQFVCVCMHTCAYLCTICTSLIPPFPGGDEDWRRGKSLTRPAWPAVHSSAGPQRREVTAHCLAISYSCRFNKSFCCLCCEIARALACLTAVLSGGGGHFHQQGRAVNRCCASQLRPRSHTE